MSSRINQNIPGRKPIFYPTYFSGKYYEQKIIHSYVGTENVHKIKMNIKAFFLLKTYQEKAIKSNPSSVRLINIDFSERFASNFPQAFVNATFN